MVVAVAVELVLEVVVISSSNICMTDNGSIVRSSRVTVLVFVVLIEVGLVVVVEEGSVKMSAI